MGRTASLRDYLADKGRSEGFLSEEYNLETGSSVIKYKSKDGLERYIAGSTNPNGAAESAISLTWLELYDLRSNSLLTPGCLYRITDYKCTVNPDNPKIQAANNQFDIILLALTNNELSEEGWACMHENIYNAVFSDGIIKKCYLFAVSEGIYNIVDCETLLGLSGLVEGENEDFIVDEETKTITMIGYAIADFTNENVTYNYFQNNNFSAWKIWYSLDNNTDRFDWANDSLDETVEEIINGEYIRSSDHDTIINNVNYYGWSNGIVLKYTTSEKPNIGDDLYNIINHITQGKIAKKNGTVTDYIPGHIGKCEPAEINLIRYSDLSLTNKKATAKNSTETIDGNTYYAWQMETDGILMLTVLTLSETPSVGDTVFELNEVGFQHELVEIGTVTSYKSEIIVYNGRGVIYRMIDDLNNDLPYDFKNIMFTIPLTDGEYDVNGTDTWVYTFSQTIDNVIVDLTLGREAYNNHIMHSGSIVNKGQYSYSLYKNIFYGDVFSDISLGAYSSDNLFLGECHNIIFLDNYNNNIITDCSHITFMGETGNLNLSDITNKAYIAGAEIQTT